VRSDIATRVLLGDEARGEQRERDSQEESLKLFLEVEEDPGHHPGIVIICALQLHRYHICALQLTPTSHLCLKLHINY